MLRLRALADKLYREPNPSADASVRALWPRTLFVIGLVSVGALLSIALIIELHVWRRLAPDFALDRGAWKIHLGAKPDSCYLPKVGADCPAHPGNGAISGSAHGLADLNRVLSEEKPKAFWLGYRLDGRVLGQAVFHRAHHLVLGWLKGRYQVWVNGHFIAEVPERNQTPMVFNLPPSLLDEGQDLFIAVHLIPRKSAKNVVPFTAGFGEGLTKLAGARSFERFFHFIEKTKAFALFSAYLIFALVFFLFWTGNRVQTEYLYLSVFALLGCVPEILYSDAFTFHISDTLALPVYFLWSTLKACAALVLGLSFARSRSSLFKYSSATLLAIGLLIVFGIPLDYFADLRKPFMRWLIPGVFLLGAFACGTQAAALAAGAERGQLQARIRQLVLFALTLTALAAVNFQQFHLDFNIVLFKLLWGVPEFLLVSFLGYLALKGYQHQAGLLNVSPLSPYHRRTHPPDRIQGVVMMLDLKNSEYFFRLSLELGQSSPIVPLALSRIAEVLTENGAVILRAEGDEAIAFFDEKAVANPLFSALLACDRARRALDELAAELAFPEPTTNETIGLHFRAGIAEGALRPTWTHYHDRRLPSWEQVGESKVFVDAARVMEIEKTLDSENREISQVLVESRARKKWLGEDPVPGLRGSFTQCLKTVVGKHQRTYLIDVYRPEEDGPALRLVS